ncbi:MAG: succinylglutamate desuccinylase/aspartoacylase family protein [bacterium]
MHSESQIRSEVDFDLEGKHSGYLRLPHSVHHSAYGWIPIPVISVKNGNGPVVLLMGGNHGDEYEGQIALSQLARTLEPTEINGQLIILPMSNYPAANAGLRTSPIDQGNLNRSFPGDPFGTPTEMMAHYIESVLLARSDFLLDIHSGGSSLLYRPTLLMTRSADSEQQQRNLDLLSSFGFLYAVLFEAAPTGNYSSSAAQRQNVISITAEIAGAGTVDVAALKQLERGLGRYLNHIGVTTSEHKTTEAVDHDTLFYEVRSDDLYICSYHRGLFEPAVEIGDEVSKGQIAGWIHHPDTPLKPPHIIYFDVDATVICKRAMAMAERGDCLYELATPTQFP